MIIDINDITAELYDEFPELEPKAIDKICKKGLAGINKLMRKGEELIITGEERKIVKFFIPLKPEDQHELSLINAAKRAAKYKEEKDGQESN